MSKEEVKINVRDWIILSTTMIGAVLMILALIWVNPPSSGIVSVTFLIMLSFILFVNSVSSNSRAHFETGLENPSEDHIKRFVSFAEYTFGLGFTLVITAFTILGYKYLSDFTDNGFLALLLPVVFLLTTLILILIYNVISYSGKALKSLRSLKRNLWILMEAGCLFLIILDYYTAFNIP